MDNEMMEECRVSHRGIGAVNCLSVELATVVSVRSIA